MAPLSRTFSLAWGVARHPRQSETQSGDDYVVITHEEGALIAVIDGLGHGVDAAHAAQLAVALLRDSPLCSLTKAITHCHEEMRRSRGAVISLASFYARRHTLTWLGVGNVSGILFHVSSNRPCETLRTHRGVVGYRLPPLQEEELPISCYDTLILTTDGIADFTDRQLSLLSPPQTLAEEILSKHAKQNDDALVLVTRWKEVAP